MNFLLRLNANQIRRFAICVGLLFSLISVSINPVFGPDGVVYLIAAQTLLEQGLQQSLAIYTYPTYPGLIALAHSLTALPYDMAAHLVNALCFAVLVYAFIKLAERCYPGPFIALSAAAVILLNPAINGIRFDVLRDFGYWAFVLLAMERHVAFNSKPHFLTACGWFFACLAATFFRPEAILFLAMPLVYLVYVPVSYRDSLLRILRLLLLPLLFLSAMLVIQLSGVNDSPAYFLETLSKKFTYKWDNIGEQLLILVKQYQEIVLDGRNSELAPHALAASLLAVLLVKLFNSMHMLYLTGFVYGTWKYRPTVHKQSRWILLSWLILLLLIPVAFLVIERFLAERYVAILTILLCLPISQAVVKAYQLTTNKALFGRIAAAVCVALLFESFVSFGAKHDHFLDARQWLAKNTAHDDVLVSNDMRAIYGVEQKLDWKQTQQLVVKGTLSELACQSADFYIYKHSRKSKHVKNFGSSKHSAVLRQYFSSKRGHHVDIFECK